MAPAEITLVAGCDAAHPDRRGGQHVARTCTAVLATHNPTGVAFRSDTERSQFANRERAIEKLALLVQLAQAPGRTWSVDARFIGGVLDGQCKRVPGARRHVAENIDGLQEYVRREIRRDDGSIAEFVYELIKGDQNP